MHLYRNACIAILRHYGEQNQMIKAIEELAGLIKALAKVANKGVLITNNEKQNAAIIEEIADCKIMLCQLEEIVENKGFRKDLQGAINLKIGRTLQQMAEEKEKFNETATNTALKS